MMPAGKIEDRARRREATVHWIHELAGWYITQVERLGWELYVFLGMLIESSFIPFPSEIIMPPAGYQAGSVAHLIGLIVLGTLGSLGGGLINYYLGRWLGRPFFVKYGRFVLINESKLAKMDKFWERHGEASTFIARLVPAVRQLISIPAGISRMNVWKFSLYTSLGAGSWVTVLAIVGWSFRDWTTEDFAEKLKGELLPYVGGVIVLLIVAYVLKVRWSSRKTTETP
jgi:membrane protein DedA with SNARE-associated domain